MKIPPTHPMYNFHKKKMQQTLNRLKFERLLILCYMKVKLHVA